MIILVPIWIIAVCLAAAGLVTVVGWSLVALLVIIIASFLLLILPVAFIAALVKKTKSAEEEKTLMRSLSPEDQLKRRAELQSSTEVRQLKRKIAREKQVETLHYISIAKAEARVKERQNRRAIERRTRRRTRL